MGQQPVSFIHMVVKLGYCNAGERNQERSTDLKCQILSTLIIHVGCCSAVNLFNTRPFHFHLSKSGGTCSYRFIGLLKFASNQSLITKLAAGK